MVVEFVHSFPLPSYGERRYHFPQASFHKLLHAWIPKDKQAVFVLCLSDTVRLYSSNLS